MALETFLIPPDQAGYAVEDGDTFVMVQLEGGLSKVRRDVLGAARIVDVTWIFDRNTYRYFTAFYETVLAQGSLPFYMDLILDHPIPATYECRFYPNKKLSEQKGLAYTVQAKLEALPPAANASLDNSIVDAYEANPNSNLIDFGIGDLPQPPQLVGFIPTLMNGIGDVVNYDISSYFSDPDLAGLTYVAAGLPTELEIDEDTGIITGTVTQSVGIVTTTIFATNDGGEAIQEFDWLIVNVAVVHLSAPDILESSAIVYSSDLVVVPT